MAALYILTMAISFSCYFGGTMLPYVLKYGVCFLWVVVYLGSKILCRGKIKGRTVFYIQLYMYPLFLMALWSAFLVVLNSHLTVDMYNFVLTLNDMFYFMIPPICAICAADYFGRKSITYSMYALVVSIVANFIYSTILFGPNILIEYLVKTVTGVELIYASTVFNFSSALEVQDATMAILFYLIYYVVFDEEDDIKTRVKYIIILLICSFPGYKRTAIIGGLGTMLVIYAAKRLPFKFEAIARIVGIIFMTMSIGYVVVVKTGLFAVVVDALGINVTGRTVIYEVLSSYFDLSFAYLGKGFGVVDKTMYNTIGFASHNIILRMYAELGCIPFLLWMFWYLIKAPEKIARMYGRNAGLMMVASTVYMFFTYFIENTMNLLCFQYSYIAITVAMSVRLTEEEKQTIAEREEAKCRKKQAKRMGLTRRNKNTKRAQEAVKVVEDMKREGLI